MIGAFRDILTRAKDAGEQKRAAIALPGRRHLEVLEKAVQAGLIIPVLVGDQKMLEDLRKGTSLAASGCRIIDEPDPAQALACAIALVKNREADILLQGESDHQTFIDRVSDAKAGLMNGRLMSYVSLYELPERNKLILVTDTYIQNQPSLADKQWILENALRLAALLEIPKPKVAVLAAIEQVNPGIPSKARWTSTAPWTGRRPPEKACTARSRETWIFTWRPRWTRGILWRNYLSILGKCRWPAC
jgi:phosphate butyryltransferase